MVSAKEVERQLEHVGCNFKLWGRSEVRELSTVLMPGEAIAQAVNGSYDGGFALLVVTNYRVLLIDRKPMLLTIGDLRYDMVAEVDLHARLLGATLRIFTPMRNLVFNSWDVTRLRKSMGYVQQRVMEIRQHGIASQLPQQQVGAPQPLTAFNAQPAAATGQAGTAPYVPMNPYTKTPLFSRRRNRFPNL